MADVFSNENYVKLKICNPETAASWMARIFLFKIWDRCSNENSRCRPEGSTLNLNILKTKVVRTEVITAQTGTNERLKPFSSQNSKWSQAVFNLFFKVSREQKWRANETNHGTNKAQTTYKFLGQNSKRGLWKWTKGMRSWGRCCYHR